MLTLIAIGLAFAIVRASTASPTMSAPSAGAPRVVVLDLRDTIQPASLRYLERGLELAADQNAALVLIELDTPGGLLDSLRGMISAILASRVPVAVYVAPSGARAASAGFFLLIAADVAAMAPGTNTGAAHPVEIGVRREKKDESKEDPGEDIALEKAEHDAAALARSLAERRGRNVERAEEAVTESRSFTAVEAHAKDLIDVIAIDRANLIETLDERTITRFDGSKQTLELRGAVVTPVARTFAERVLGVIASPATAYLLVMLGLLCLVIELTSPGFWGPGILGVLSLLAGLYGLSVLPVNVVGVLLVLAGLGLLVAEVFVTSYGLLAVAGTVSFVIGSLMFIDASVPELTIGPAVVIPTAVVLLLAVVLLSARVARTRHLPIRSGVEAMLGERGSVVESIDPERAGRVFVHGELWTATSTAHVPKGAQVRVEGIDGLCLRVAPLFASAGR